MYKLIFKDVVRLNIGLGRFENTLRLKIREGKRELHQIDPRLLRITKRAKTIHSFRKNKFQLDKTPSQQKSILGLHGYVPESILYCVNCMLNLTIYCVIAQDKVRMYYAHFYAKFNTISLKIHYYCPLLYITISQK